MRVDGNSAITPRFKDLEGLVPIRAKPHMDVASVLNDPGSVPVRPVDQIEHDGFDVEDVAV